MSLHASIYISPIVLHWCLTGRGRSALPVQQAQVGVLIEVAAAVHQVETAAPHLEGVLASERGELGTVQLLAAKLSCLDTRYNKKFVR